MRDDSIDIATFIATAFFYQRRHNVLTPVPFVTRPRLRTNTLKNKGKEDGTAE